jgi:hypothetical protein
MTRPVAEVDSRRASVPPERSAGRPRERSTLRSVVVPSEHGGWGLTLEPVLLGLLVAPSWSGLGLGLAAAILFLARTPLKVILVDHHRHRRLERTRTAVVVVGGYALLVGACLAVPLLQAPPSTWWPLVLIVPLAGIELWYDMRSRGRRLVPELAGAVGIAGIATMIVLADGGPTGVAVACWVLLSARAATSIPNVRDLVQGLHGRRRQPRLVVAGDLAAAALAAIAVAIEPAALAGAVAIVGLIVVQRVLRLRPTPRAVVLGLTQTGMGLVVIAVTAAGLLQA